MKNDYLIDKLIKIVTDIPIIVVDKKKKIIGYNNLFSILLQNTDISKNKELNQRIENFINKPENFLDIINKPFNENLVNNETMYNLLVLLKSINYKITHFTSVNVFLNTNFAENPVLTTIFIFRVFSPYVTSKSKISKTSEFFLMLVDISKEKFLNFSQQNVCDEINKKYTFLLQVANRVFSTVKGFSETLLIDQYKDLNLIYNFIKIIDSEVTQGIKILLSFNLSDNIAKFNIQEINLYEFLTKIVDKFYSQILDKSFNIKFNFYIQPNIPQIYTDPSKLELCIYNLLDNALRFRDENKEENIIELQAFFESSINKIFIIIKDNGIGMNNEEIEKVGNLFQTFSDKSGIGLGMYIIYKIVKNLKWEIKVESEKYKYTQVTLIIPVEFDKSIKM